MKTVLLSVFMMLAALAHAGTAAEFIQSDATTQGTWQGMYGKDASFIATSNSIVEGHGVTPFAAVQLVGASNYVWENDSLETRALKTPYTRIASTWYGGGSFNIDVTIKDDKIHQVALYALDWDSNRVENIQVFDVDTMALLDTQTVTGFNTGKWLSWNVSGHVTFKITRVSGGSAVISGLMFGPQQIHASLSCNSTGAAVVCQ